MPVEADGAGAVARGSGFRFAFAFGAATACCFAAFFDDRPPGFATGGGAVGTGIGRLASGLPMRTVDESVP